MKKRFLLVLAAMLCLVMIAFAIPAMADSEPTTSIMGHNLALEDAVDIIYYVDFQNVPDGAESGVLVWRTPQDSYAYGTEDAKLTTVGKDYGYDKFIFPGVAAKMMTQDFYAVSYIKNGDEVTYSALDKYSVLQYAYNKKGDTTKIGGSKTLGELLTGMLDYGTLAQQYFSYNTSHLANATYYQISVVGATLPDGTTKGLYRQGESVTLTTNAADFRSWKNSVGEFVSGEATIVVTANKEEAYFATSDEPEVVTLYSEGLAFTSIGGGECVVSGIGECTDSDIVIPPVSPKAQTVVGIGNNAFEECATITSVVIPDGVITIDEFAFSACSNLASVSIPDSVTSVKEWAFADCTSLTQIVIPAGVTNLENNVFYGCSALESLTIPFVGENGTANTHFGFLFGASGYARNADYVPASLKTVVITGGESIGDYAFNECSNLESILIPDTVTSIGYRAFANCSSITSLVIPDSVTYIREEALAGCSSLESLTIPFAGPRANPIAANNEMQGPLGWLFEERSTQGTTTQRYYIAGRNSCLTGYFYIPASLHSVTIGGQYIWKFTFENCTNITEVVIENGPIQISNQSFASCSNLTTVTIPASVTRIDVQAFINCTSLKRINYTGTKAQWYAVSKASNGDTGDWDYNTGNYRIYCSDGVLTK